MADLLQIRAPTPDAVHLFRYVDHLKIGGEAADDLQSHCRIEVFDEIREFFVRPLVIFASPNRTQARVLDKLK